MRSAEFTIVEVLDRDDCERSVGVTVGALERTVGISNTTERAVRIVVGGAERVLWPSPRRAECDLVGVLLWRAAGERADFDFRVVGEAHLVEPVELDALCAELLLPGGSPCERSH